MSVIKLRMIQELLYAADYALSRARMMTRGEYNDLFRELYVSLDGLKNRVSNAIQEIANTGVPTD